MEKPRNHNRLWTEEELSYVRKHRGKVSLHEIAAKLGRTRNACAMAPKYQKRPKRLRREYPDYAALGIPCPHPHLQKAGFTNCSKHKQLWRCAACRRCSVDPKRFSGPRTRKIVPLLTKQCPWCGKPVVRKSTFGVTRNWFCCVDHGTRWNNAQAVIRRGKRGSRKDRRPNDQKRWTDQEIAFLRDNYETMGYEDMALALGRGTSGVHAMCRKSGFSRARNWTAAEERFLIANQHRGWKWCGEQLGRGKFAVSIRANAIGLYRNRRKAGVKRGAALLRDRKRKAAKAIVAVQAESLAKSLEAIQ